MQPLPPIESETRQWSMILHLSLLAGLLLPGAGFILPIALWQVKKNELPGIDAHGKVIANWLISAIIYASGCVVLGLIGSLFFDLGFFSVRLLTMPVLAILAVLEFAFPIIGGIKANDGVLWRYPLSFRFFT